MAPACSPARNCSRGLGAVCQAPASRCQLPFISSAPNSASWHRPHAQVALRLTANRSASPLAAAFAPSGRPQSPRKPARCRAEGTPALVDVPPAEENSSGAVAPAVLAELKAYLERELPRLFMAEGMRSEGKFEDVVEFEDPITRYDSLAGYLFNIAMLKALFSPVFQLHSCYQTGPAELTTRWTMKMYFRLLPWQPELVFTGLSIYGINPASGKFKSHKDIWDSIEDNAYFSRQGLLDLLNQCAQLYGTPESMGSPHFDVLLRRENYEVRQYSAYAAAEVPWGRGAQAVGVLESGTGAEETRQLQGRAQGGAGSLAKPLLWLVQPREGGTPSVTLRQPLKGAATPSSDSTVESTSPSVSAVQVPPQACAVTTFPGLASPERFEAAAALLRASVLRDGLTPALGQGAYEAARYYGADPLLPPPLLRNEVLMPLENFKWPPL